MRHKIRGIHFVGVGGAGMRGLAEAMRGQGYRVSGSDLREQPALARLRKKGVRVFVGHSPQNIRGADCVVYSSAVAADNPERVAAARAGLFVVPRAQMLNELLRLKTGVAVAGSHGKTTATGMIFAALSAAGRDPACVIGGRLRDVDAHAQLGGGDFIVVEADESDASFTHLLPALAVVTNIDDDHLPAFGGKMKNLKSAFRVFLGNLPFYGAAAVCGDDQNAMAVAQESGARILSYGVSPGCDFVAEKIRARPPDRTEFILRHRGGREKMALRASGLHNVRNALAACAVASELEIGWDAVRDGLANFAGVGRRMESRGDIRVGGKTVRLVDDYAHHPTEISATIAALREAHPRRRIVAVFQPHRFTRTRDLMARLARSVREADAAVVSEIHSAGEKPIPGVDGKTLAKKAKATYVSRLEDAPPALAKILRDGDVLATLGAGSIANLPGILKGEGEGESENESRSAGESISGPISSGPVAGLRGRWRENFPMSKLSTWRVGGPARVVFEPADLADLKAFLAARARRSPRPEMLFVGHGSNLLVRDGGFPGVVVRAAPGLSGLRAEPDGGVYAEAGVACAKVARFCARRNLAEAEFLAGIPGAVGGALAMNAGCHGGEIWSFVRRVLVVDENGESVLQPGDFSVRYREVRFKNSRTGTGEKTSPFFAAAWLKFPPGDAKTARAKLDALLQKRRETQPLDSPSAGSVFRNPPGDFAGRLMEECGLKGAREGGAEVSRKHGNFIVNRGGASARDVETLMARARKIVRARTGVRLVPEVRIAGAPADGG